MKLSIMNYFMSKGGCKFNSYDKHLILFFIVTLVNILTPTQCSIYTDLKKDIDLTVEVQQSTNVSRSHLQVSNSDTSLQTLNLHTRQKRRIKSPANVLPEFSAPIGNVTAVLGRDVRLVCTVENLGHYQVAWLKEETRTILSIDTNIIITNYRIFLIPDEEERKWVLHIKDVQESDRGFYQCQVNTNPMRSTVGYLEVVVPPKILEAQTSQVAETAEHSNVSIQCKASGHPRPTILWRREDGQPIRLNGQFDTGDASSTTNGSDPMNLPALSQPNPTIAATTSTISTLTEIRSERLSFLNVDRSMAGLYVCTASNGIPIQVTKRIPLYVKFQPKVSVKSKFISVSLGEPLEIDCLIEAFPKPTNYWSRKPASRTESSLSISTKNNAYDTDNFREDNAYSERARITIPKPRQMAIYEQVTVAQPQVDDRFVTVQPEVVRSPITGTAASMPNSEKLVGESKSTRQYNVLDNNQMNDNPQRSKLQISYSSNELIRHNFEQRLKLRQVVMPVSRSDLDHSLAQSEDNPSDSTTSESFGSEQDAASSSSLNISSAYVTVKQTAVNPYTYKLRLSIARMQADDFGAYVCISSNPLGTSQEYTYVTRADRSTSVEKSEGSSEMDYQRDSLVESPPRQSSYSQQHQGQASSPMRNRLASGANGRVYDENYLQAIKNRYQSGNFAATGKLQQKLRMRPERSSGSCWIRVKGSTVAFVAFATSVVTLVQVWHQNLLKPIQLNA